MHYTILVAERKLVVISKFSKIYSFIPKLIFFHSQILGFELSMVIHTLSLKSLRKYFFLLIQYFKLLNLSFIDLQYYTKKWRKHSDGNYKRDVFFLFYTKLVWSQNDCSHFSLATKGTKSYFYPLLNKFEWIN